MDQTNLLEELLNWYMDKAHLAAGGATAIYGSADNTQCNRLWAWSADMVMKRSKVTTETQTVSQPTEKHSDPRSMPTLEPAVSATPTPPLSTISGTLEHPERTTNKSSGPANKKKGG